MPSSASNIIQAASEHSYPPFCVVTDNNQADGFSVELLRAALQAMHKEVTFRVGPWAEIKQDLAEGRIQALPLVGRTLEREDLYDFTFPYLTLHGTILVRDSETSIQSLADLRGKQVAVMDGDNAEEFLQRMQLEARVVTTETFEVALRQLAAGQHDAVVIQKLLSLQLMKQLEITNLKSVGPPLQEFVQSFCFAVTKGAHTLLSTLNEGLSIVFADGTFNRLRVKWFAPIEAMEHQRSRIVIGGDSNYPPYEFLDESGQPSGYNVDLTRAVAKELGIDIEIRLGPWAEIRDALEQGKVDLIQGMFYSAERESTYAFSTGHSVVNHVIVGRTNTLLPQSLAELSDRSIAVMDGDILQALAVKQGFADQLNLVKSQEDALRLVAEGTTEFALVAKLPAFYWIHQHRWQNLQVGSQSLISPEYCYAALHGKDRLVRLFSAGLANAKGTGQYREIYAKWLGIYEAPTISWREVLKYSLFTTGPILILLGGSVLWSRSLRQRVTQRTKELQAEVAERQQGELEIRAKNTELDKKNAELERFAYTVSHDLKSPLVTLKSFLGFVEKDLQSGDRERVANDLRFMHSAIDKMNQLLGDLLHFSQTGWQGASSEKVSFRAVVSQALSLLAGPIRKAGVQVSVAEEAIQFCGDQTRLIQIWQNLIDNAVKYRCPDATWPKSIPLVQVGVDTSGKEPTFFVRDNGIGIEPKFQNKIFGLFNQLDPKVDGSGVGLALVARIVELYDGKIWVDSKGCGHGTCFRFTLPGALKDSAKDLNKAFSATSD